MTAKRENWKTLLDPWGDELAKLTVSIEAHCSNLSDADLEAFGLAARKPTTTNCGWGTYRVAGMAWDAYRCEKYRRQQALKSA